MANTKQATSISFSRLSVTANIPGNCTQSDALWVQTANIPFAILGNLLLHVHINIVVEISRNPISAHPKPLCCYTLYFLLSFIIQTGRQTGCSFARNFANFHRNVGILIGSLLWAICNQLEQLARDSCKFARVDSSANWKFRSEHGSVDF